MAANQDTPRLNILQRLDLALASRVADAPPLILELTAGLGLPTVPEVDCRDWVAGLLGLRGLRVDSDEVQAVIDGDAGRFDPEHHEYALIEGLLAVHQRLVEPGAGFRPLPDGWILMELFKQFVGKVARFRNNHIRKDTPWDAVLYVKYPDRRELTEYLDNFHRDNAYMDNSVRFESLHPVRQAFRVLWHFARIAPFPDFNMTMAWIAMDMFLRHAGYPMLVPQHGDRERLHRMMTGPVPLRIRALEHRMLESLEALET